MKNWRVLLTLAGFFSIGVTAQITSAGNESSVGSAIVSTTKASTAADVNNSFTLTSGTPVLAELRKTVKAKKAKAGDQVKAEVVQDVIFHGKIVIRRGSKLVGHVTEARGRSKEYAESRLGIMFDKAVLKGGGEMPLNAGICAMAAAARTSMVDKPDEMLPPSLMGGIGSNQNSGPQPMGGRSPTVTRGAPSTPTINPSPASSAGNPTGPIIPVPVAKPQGTTFKGSVLSSGSRGVFGIPGIKLRSQTSGKAQNYVVSSTTQDVQLESGIQLLLQVNEAVVAQF